MVRATINFGLILLSVLALLVSGAAAAEGAPKNALSKAEHFLIKLEKHVKRAGGKPFPLTYDDTQALKRVTKLNEDFPNDPDVEALVVRARAGLMASKGTYIEITPDMLAFRKMEAILVKRVSEKADTAWQEYLSGLAAKTGLIEKAFPRPDPMESDPNETIGKYVVIDDFRYPDNEFTDMGGQYLFVGSGAKGYYYVQLSSRSWLGAYESLKRYRRQVSQDTPIPWTVAGEITTVSLLIPEAGEEKKKAPAFGWIVKPTAIYLPGRVFALADPSLELGGAYSSEAELQALKQDLYTYTQVPADVTPKQLVEIFATAIKEKNWDLYLECIDPARQKTITAVQRLQYFYDNNLERYVRWYVYVEVMDPKEVQVLKGVVIKEDSFEAKLLTKAQKEALTGRDQEVVEQVMVPVRTFDEHGLQTAFPKDVTLRRYNGGRWYIAAGYPL